MLAHTCARAHTHTHTDTHTHNQTGWQLETGVPPSGLLHTVQQTVSASEQIYEAHDQVSGVLAGCSNKRVGISLLQH
jgi:hypothetical protein